MRNFFKKSVTQLKPYKVPTFDIWNESNSFLKLDWNESTIPPSPKVISAISKLINKNSFNWYPPLLNKKLLELIADYSDVDVENVQYFTGSDSFHEYLIQTCVEPNDKALIISPTYDNFRVVIESYGGLIDNFNLNQNNFSLNEEKLLSYIEGKKPKLVYICNPNNPTGTIHSIEYCEKLLNNFPDIFFIFDEAYYEFSDVTVSKLVSKYNNFIISRTFSKAFGLASFRIGYAIGPEKIIETINKVRNPKSVPLFSQIAAIEALQDIDYMRSFKKEIDKSRVLMKVFLDKKKIAYISGGGNYIMVKSDFFDKNKMMNHLFKENILVRDLNHLDLLSGYFRITLGTSVQMKRVIKTIDSYLDQNR